MDPRLKIKYYHLLRTLEEQPVAPYVNKIKGQSLTKVIGENTVNIYYVEQAGVFLLKPSVVGGAPQRKIIVI
jgi:hypothetical protein